jgi:riboflavin biosynthesis pyrimidine reductase
MPMRQLLPVPVEQIDPAAAYDADRRDPPANERPWILLNMIASVDGATAVEGRAGGLGGPADTKVLSLLRNVADVVLVGAGTIRAEGYAPHRPSTSTRARRAARGQRPVTTFAVLSGSLDLDTTGPLFTEAEPESRTIVFCPDTADPERRGRVEEVADVVITGDTTVDIRLAIGELWRRGARIVLCEGGPTLNGVLLDENLIDELCLTISPRLAGGPALRVVNTTLAPPAPIPLRLERVLEAEDGFLFLRYVRADSSDLT